MHMQPRATQTVTFQQPVFEDMLREFADWVEHNQYAEDVIEAIQYVITEEGPALWVYFVPPTPLGVSA